MSNKCNLCGEKVSLLKYFGEFPIVNNLLSDSEFSPRSYDFSLYICFNCGLSQTGSTIDKELFYTNYATPSSDKPNPHMRELIDTIKKLIDQDSKIIEIGCNDGSFLDELQYLGFCNLTGVEPTTNTYKLASAKGHNVINSFLTSSTVSELIRDGSFDLVVSRQVLEHISDLKDFGNAINHLVKPEGYLVIEVPNSMQNLQNYDYSLWEEHVNYFTPQTLRNYLGNIGFEIVKEWKSLFAGECLSILAKKVSNRNYKIEITNQEILLWQAWANNFESFGELVKDEIRSLCRDKELILYGVGARSSVFVNFLGLSNTLTFAVDDAPSKQNKFMPHSKTEIISLSHDKITGGGKYLILLGVNAENEKKLIKNSFFVKQNSFISILPPSEYLPKSWKQFIKNH